MVGTESQYAADVSNLVQNGPQPCNELRGYYGGCTVLVTALIFRSINYCVFRQVYSYRL